MSAVTAVETTRVVPRGSCKPGRRHEGTASALATGGGEAWGKGNSPQPVGRRVQSSTGLVGTVGSLVVDGVLRTVATGGWVTGGASGGGGGLPRLARADVDDATTKIEKMTRADLAAVATGFLPCRTLGEVLTVRG
jgi:hypothetical protein